MKNKNFPNTQLACVVLPEGICKQDKRGDGDKQTPYFISEYGSRLALRLGVFSSSQSGPDLCDGMLDTFLISPSAFQLHEELPHSLLLTTNDPQLKMKQLNYKNGEPRKSTETSEKIFIETSDLGRI